MSIAEMLVIEDQGHVLHVTIVGEVDGELSGVEGLVDGAGQRVVINAAGITFAGSRFLTWLMRTERSAGQLILRHPSVQVLKLLEHAGLTNELTIET